MKLELVLKEELLQSGCELAPEDATQRGDGQEERRGQAVRLEDRKRDLVVVEIPVVERDRHGIPR